MNVDFREQEVIVVTDVIPFSQASSDHSELRKCVVLDKFCIFRGDKVDSFTPLFIQGEVDVYNTPVLKQQIEIALETLAEKERIFCVMSKASFKLDDQIVESHGVEYLDSTAIGVLVGSYKRCRAKSVELCLVIDNFRIRRIFEITGLDKVFDIYDAETSPIPLSPPGRK